MLLPLMRLLAVLLATALLSLVLACGDDDDEVDEQPTVAVPQDTAPPPSPELAQQPQPAQQLDASLSLVADGVISINVVAAAFTPNRWGVSLGETATILVVNADTQQHNLRIAGLDGQYNTQDDAVTAPETVGAGETGELTFVPQVAGNYTFRCDFHPDTMGGQIEVD